MTIKKRNIGRPYSDPASARARYNDLKQAAATAKAEFEKFQKQCIADDLLNRVIVKETVIKSFVRKNREDDYHEKHYISVYIRRGSHYHLDCVDCHDCGSHIRFLISIWCCRFHYCWGNHGGICHHS